MSDSQAPGAEVIDKAEWKQVGAINHAWPVPHVSLSLLINSHPAAADISAVALSVCGLWTPNGFVQCVCVCLVALFVIAAFVDRKRFNFHLFYTC